MGLESDSDLLVSAPAALGLDLSTLLLPMAVGQAGLWDSGCHPPTSLGAAGALFQIPDEFAPSPVPLFLGGLRTPRRSLNLCLLATVWPGCQAGRMLGQTHRHSWAALSHG